MATSVNGMYDSRELQAIHWQKELIRLGLRERFYAGRLSDLADRIEAAVPHALTWITAEGLPHSIVDAVAAVVHERLAVLRGVRQLPSTSVRISRGQSARS